MNHSQDVYDVRELAIPETKAIHYYFLSEGKESIVKLIRYEYVRQFNGKPLFNLGFGDYDKRTEDISDEVTSGNADPYRVFNTVLYTIPQLLSVHNDGVVSVRGSDSTSGYIENCRKNCTRKCGNHSCKKADRRINIYRNFVNKHYEVLNQEFTFYGTDGMDDDSQIAPYQKGKKYEGIIVEKKLN